MRSHTRHGQGRLAQRFTQLLLAKLGEGWAVLYVWPVEGYWRSQDVYRVEGQVRQPDGRVRSFGSWYTLTELVRNGISKIDDDIVGEMEVWGYDTKPNATCERGNDNDERTACNPSSLG